METLASLSATETSGYEISKNRYHQEATKAGSNVSLPQYFTLVGFISNDTEVNGKKMNMHSYN